jgi:hypothetical protein
MKTIGTYKLLQKKTGLNYYRVFNETCLFKTTCITMSGHLSTEEKALFKAEIDAKDYAFFHREF